MQKLLHILLITLAALVLLCGCDDNGDSTDGSYNVISGGTSVVVSTAEDNSSESFENISFYVPDGMETRYGSSQLDSDEQKIYDELVEEIGNFTQSVPLESDSEVYSRILNLISSEQLSYSHLVNRKLGEYNVDTQKFDINFTYRFSPEEMSEMNRQCEAEADKILANVTSDMSEYDKLKYFHDYLILNCESDSSDYYANTIYGTLVEKKALCEGYAKTFSYLCNRVGIENVIVTGMTAVAHMWNMVKVDGNWYHVDVTWDKPSGQFAQAYPDVVMYQYFMVTDSVIKNDHTIWENDLVLPRATAHVENYFIKEKLYVDDESSMKSVIVEAIDKAAKENKSTAMVKFDTTNLYLSMTGEMKEAFENNEQLFDEEIKAISEKYNIGLSIGWTDYYSAYRIIVFVIEYK